MLTDSVLTFRLSEQQRRLWGAQESGVFHAQGCAVVPAGRAAADLSRAALRAVERHEILRTTFRRRPGVRFPFQVVAGQGEVRWREVEVGREGLEELLRQERCEPFDLGEGPLVRLTLARGAGPQDLLVITLPALCGDLRTVSLLAAEILGPRPADGLEPLQYADFGRWQEEVLAGEDDDTVQGRGHWARLDLAAASSLSLPGELSPAGSGPFSPEAVQRELEPATLGRLAALARDHGASLADLLLAAWTTLLWRSGAADDLVVGRQAAGRVLEDLEGCLGPIDRAVPFAVRPAHGLAFSDLMIAVAQDVRAGEPWLELAPYPPAWSFLFAAEGLGADPQEPGPLLHLSSCGEPFKLKLVASRAADRLACEIWHDPRHYPRAEADRLAERLEVLLRAVCREPRTRLGALDALTARERLQLVLEPNRQEAARPLTRCLHELFADQAVRHPERIAVVSDQGSLTAGELEARANRLADHLRALGVGPEVRVAIFLERSAEAIVALLGVLKAGGAYVPLDPAFPGERIAGMLEQSQAAVVITRESLLDTVPDHPARRVCLDTLDTAAGEIASRIPAAPENGAGPDHLAYVLFTSGSTGRPKGVAVEHRNLLSYLAGIEERLELPPDGTFATVSTLAADLGNTAILPALARGGTLLVPSRKQVTDPALLADLFRRHPVDVLKIVPSHLAVLLLAREPAEILPRRMLILGGEAWGRELIGQARHAVPGLRIFNHYGPTETTVGVMTWEAPHPLPGGDSRPPLGRPLPGARAYLLNPELQPVPPGVTGELYLGGGGVARGYLDAPDLTAERFLPDPFAAAPGHRCYRTGDLARFGPEGELEFLGRADDQVKIRGFRIELGEIETALRRHPDIRECAVVPHEAPGGETQLAAYVVLPRGREGVADLREFLAARLPGHMVPGAFVRLETLPLTPNGKLDRRALPPPDEERAVGHGADSRPRTLLELELAKIWEDLLQMSPIGMNENFFEIGGHSLLAVRMMAQIEKRMACSLPLATLYRSPTVRELAALLEDSARLGEPRPLVPIQPHGTRAPFFCIHPMGGEVLCYYHLSRALGQDQPFYGLQARGLREPEASTLSIPEMAAQYLAAIREVVPAGPYLLGGYSFGSKVAFEIAQQIRREGEQVALLALLDGGAPGKAAQLDRVNEAIVVAQTLREDAREAGAEFSISFEEVRRREPEAQLPYVLEQARLQKRLPAEVDVPVVRQFLRGLHVRQRASAAYFPEVYPDPIVYLRSTDQDTEYLEVLRQSGYDVDDITRGWARFSAQPIEIHDISGLHETLMLPPSVRQVASTLRSAIDRAMDAIAKKEAGR